MDAELLAALTTPVDFNGEWGHWECPYEDCDTVNDDPETMFVTTCGGCNRSVALGPIEDNGWRDAWRRPS